MAYQCFEGCKNIVTALLHSCSATMSQTRGGGGGSCQYSVPFTSVSKWLVVLEPLPLPHISSYIYLPYFVLLLCLMTDCFTLSNMRQLYSV
jgi:hypothetical protein